MERALRDLSTRLGMTRVGCIDASKDKRDGYSTLESLKAIDRDVFAT